MKTRRLIINADGFGFTPGINKGILESIKYGVVTSTSCIMNFPYINGVPELIKQHKSISIGAHFNLSVGRPVSPEAEVPTLINKKGEFLGNEFVKHILMGKIRYADMEKELTAQIKVLLDIGITPSHWDGHQNRHLYPQFFAAAMRVAKRFGVKRLRTHNRYIFFERCANRTIFLSGYYLTHPGRFLTHMFGRFSNAIARFNGFKTADRLLSPGYADKRKKYLLETWVALMDSLPPGTSEIYCHPGYPDSILRKYAKYVDERADEIKVLTSDVLKEAIRRNNIELISFNEL